MCCAGIAPLAASKLHSVCLCMDLVTQRRQLWKEWKSRSTQPGIVVHTEYSILLRTKEHCVSDGWMHASVRNVRPQFGPTPMPSTFGGFMCLQRQFVRCIPSASVQLCRKLDGAAGAG